MAFKNWQWPWKADGAISQLLKDYMSINVSLYYHGLGPLYPRLSVWLREITLYILSNWHSIFYFEAVLCNLNFITHCWPFYFSCLYDWLRHSIINSMHTIVRATGGHHQMPEIMNEIALTQWPVQIWSQWILRTLEKTEPNWIFCQTLFLNFWLEGIHHELGHFSLLIVNMVK